MTMARRPVFFRGEWRRSRFDLYRIHPAERFDSDTGWEHCIFCGDEFPGGDRAYDGPVYNTVGERYEQYWDTEVADGPFLHPDCHDKMEVLVRLMENHTLHEFAHP